MTENEKIAEQILKDIGFDYTFDQEKTFYLGDKKILILALDAKDKEAEARLLENRKAVLAMIDNEFRRQYNIAQEDNGNTLATLFGNARKVCSIVSWNLDDVQSILSKLA